MMRPNTDNKLDLESSLFAKNPQLNIKRSSFHWVIIWVQDRLWLVGQSQCHSCSRAGWIMEALLHMACQELLWLVGQSQGHFSSLTALQSLPWVNGLRLTESSGLLCQSQGLDEFRGLIGRYIRCTQPRSWPNVTRSWIRSNWSERPT